MKGILTKFLDTIGWAYWVKITTEQPYCIYYFGPFFNNQEAKSAQPGFIEDLQSEDAKNIQVEIQRCQPEELTIFDESSDNLNYNSALAFK